MLYVCLRIHISCREHITFSTMVPDYIFKRLWQNYANSTFALCIGLHDDNHAWENIHQTKVNCKIPHSRGYARQENKHIANT